MVEETAVVESCLSEAHGALTAEVPRADPTAPVIPADTPTTAPTAPASTAAAATGGNSGRAPHPTTRDVEGGCLVDHWQTMAAVEVYAQVVDMAVGYLAKGSSKDPTVTLFHLASVLGFPLPDIYPSRVFGKWESCVCGGWGTDANDANFRPHLPRFVARRSRLSTVQQPRLGLDVLSLSQAEPGRGPSLASDDRRAPEGLQRWEGGGGRGWGVGGWCVWGGCCFGMVPLKKHFFKN